MASLGVGDSEPSAGFVFGTWHSYATFPKLALGYIRFGSALPFSFGGFEPNQTWRIFPMPHASGNSQEGSLSSHFYSYEPFSAGRGPNVLLAFKSYCGTALNIPARPHQVFATVSIERKKNET